MNKQALLKELEKLGMRPGRGLGQNFLLDGNLLDAIVREAAPEPGGRVLEVGPGFGALTGRLLQKGVKLTAIEFDHRLADYLRERYLPNPNLELLEKDACRVKYDELFPAGEKYRVIANLPYAISSVFIAKITAAENPPAELLLMLQLEMGERLAAQPGNKDYGSLTVRVQQRYEVEIARRVPPEVFYPPPKVESAVVRMRRRANDVSTVKERLALAEIVGPLFAQRRKQAGKVLGGKFGREKVSACFAKLGISMEIRPEKLSVSDFITLSSELSGEN